MTAPTIKIIRLLARGGVATSIGTMGACVGILTGVLVMPAAAQIAGATELLATSKAIAESAPLDVTRLALQVAIVAMILLAASVAAFFRIWQVQVGKPCQLTGAVAHAIIAEVAVKAITEAVRDARDKR